MSLYLKLRNKMFYTGYTVTNAQDSLSAKLRDNMLLG